MRSYWRGKNTNFFIRSYREKEGESGRIPQISVTAECGGLQEEGLVVPGSV